MHAYAVPEDVDEKAARRELVETLHALYPETREARVIDERWLLRRDCPGFPPGGFAARPTVGTPHHEVVLAGDFVRLDIPSALMERAVTSGLLAANRLLSGWSMAAEPVRSIARHGLLSRLTM